MNRENFEAVLAVMECGSFSGAAQRMFLSQSALSRRISGLEDELGIQIFNRGRGQKNIQITTEGLKFVSLYQRLEETEKEIKGISDSKFSQSLSVGSVASLSDYLLPNVISEFVRENPKCRVMFTDSHSREAYRDVMSGSLDVALISDIMYNETIVSKPFFSEPFRLVSKKKYADSRKVSSFDSSGEILSPWTPEFTRWHDYWMGSSEPLILTSEMSVIEKMLCEENTWAVVPLIVADALCRNKGLNMSVIDNPPPDEIIYTISRTNFSSESADRFSEKIREKLKETEGITLL